MHSNNPWLERILSAMKYARYFGGKCQSFSKVVKLVREKINNDFTEAINLIHMKYDRNTIIFFQNLHCYSKTVGIKLKHNGLRFINQILEEKAENDGYKSNAKAIPSYIGH